MRKIITFLGATLIKDREGNLVKTNYLHNGETYPGSVFPEALRQFTSYDKMLVFVTEKAREVTWPQLEGLNDERIIPIDIPTGNTTEELWELFGIILGQVDEGDCVIFDITQGLRSTPFLMFLFASFLKIARNVSIEAIYYGAFELGNPREDIPAPVFDLSEFVEMLDWLTATDRFVTTGDGQALTALLRKKMPPGLQMGKDESARALGKDLRSAADGIEEMSQALLMVRPFETMTSGLAVSKILTSSEKHITETAPPFGALVDRVRKSYGEFALESPLEPEAALPNLMRQLDMIKWYLAHQQAVQATLLMREWLISAFMAVNQTFPFHDRIQREKVEKQFNDAARILSDLGEVGIANFSSALQALPAPEMVIKNWSKLSQMRNDIAHCGHRSNAQSAAKLIRDASSVYDDLCQIVNEVL
jgi:hypothetical protein